MDFDTAAITAELRQRLEKFLTNKGVAVRWIEDEAQAELKIRIVSIDKGDMLLRLVFLILGPAILEADVSLERASTITEFHHVQRAHFGFWSGRPRTMLKFCAFMLAEKIGKDVARCLTA